MPGFVAQHDRLAANERAEFFGQLACFGQRGAPDQHRSNRQIPAKDGRQLEADVVVRLEQPDLPSGVEAVSQPGPITANAASHSSSAVLMVRLKSWPAVM